MREESLRSMAVTRRGLLALGVGAFVVATGPILGRRGAPLVRRSLPVMGTVADIIVVARDTVRGHAAIDAALAELDAVDRLMTRFSTASDIGRANTGAAREAIAVAPSTALVLREALGWAEATGGSFDPSLGRASRLWDVGHRTSPPAETAIRPLAGRGLYRALDIDRWRGEAVVRFGSPDLEIDLGGIAKGYGVDRAVATLRRHGIERGIVNVGGDLYALGDAGEGAPWRVGIQSPWDPDRVLEEMSVREAAVATSGDYLRFFTYHGRRYHHLLDPATAAPRETAVHSVTIVADSCIDADAAATAVYGMPDDRAHHLLRTRPGHVRLVRTLAGDAPRVG